MSQQREEDQPAASGHKQATGEDAVEGSITGRSQGDTFSEGDAGSEAAFKGDEAGKRGDTGDAETTEVRWS